MDLVNIELAKVFAELRNLKKDINTIKENLDFIKEQNSEILLKIHKVEDKGKYPDLRENFENINRKLSNIENKHPQDIDSLIKNLEGLSLKETGKEIFIKKMSNTFYRI